MVSFLKDRTCKFFLMLLVLQFTGCSYFNKIRSLKNIPVKDIYLSYDSNILRIPGNSFQIGISVITNNNDTLRTKGFLNGTLRWSNFKIRTFGCDYSNGKLYIPENDWAMEGTISIDIEVKRQTNVKKYYAIQKNYLSGFKIFPQNQFNKAPGSVIKLGIIENYDTHDKIILKKTRDVTDFIKKCNTEILGGSYYNGSFRINENIYSFYNHWTGIAATSLKNNFLTDTFDFQLDYINQYNASYVSSHGSDGHNGFDGINGNSGSFYGQNGTDGANGSHGSEGYKGERGHDIKVVFDAYFDTVLHTDLCFITLEDLKEKRLADYLVNPKGGTFTLFTQGGKGGDGGRGGSGGNGGNGSAGETRQTIIKKIITETDSTGTHNKEIVETILETFPGGHGGSGGYGGNGGYGGAGGDGGNIYVYYTERAYQYLNCLNTKSIGGSGGFSGSGGYGGSGGTGGSGNPNGANGSSGQSGTSGWQGSPGMNGQVFYYLISDDWDR
jgi:hypothetical protein